MPYISIVNDLNKKVSEHDLSLPKFKYITDGKLHTIEILATPLYEGHSADREEITNDVNLHLAKFIDQMKLLTSGLEVAQKIIVPTSK